MVEASKHRPLARQWLLRAVHDIEAAELLNEVEDIEPWLACFHAQQAAAKALIAALVSEGVAFARSEELTGLFEKLPESWPILADRGALVRLGEWEERGRFPDVGKDPDRDDAIDALNTATALFDQLVEALETRGISMG